MNRAPRPGPVHGLYPQRDAVDVAWLRPIWRRLGLHQLLPWHAARPPGPEFMLSVRQAQTAWACIQDRNRPLHLQRLRARLGKAGWLTPPLRAQALGCAAALMHRHDGRNPYDTQLMCADLLLRGHLAEMATGEGKTAALALAAAVAAMAGVPVHVMTANDYLAQRDALARAPFFQALGLRTGLVLGSTTPEARRDAYACDITYCTAREVAFDHLRDRQTLREEPTEVEQRAYRLSQGPDAAGATPLLRGLCMALVDEADSLLIDEATLPLVLAEAVNDPRHRAWCFQALALAREIGLGRHALLDPDTQQVRWTAAGLQYLSERAEPWGGTWLNRQHRQDLAASALVALHALRRDEHYVVCDGRVQLLDANTGRQAYGRVWSRGLQTLVEMKEGCKTSPATRTKAQTSYQRFFSRYGHLAGTSGTLKECRRELAAVYGLQVVTVPRRLPSRRIVLPERTFARNTERQQALVDRIQLVQAQGRPVLVGVASVAQAQQLSPLLAAAGLAHQVLDASQNHEEADIVAHAGRSGQVTVATAMAGRGTDIHLETGVAQRGGLHVIVCQDNRSARLDRQFMGRCARQGDPGSAELWHAADAHKGPAADWNLRLGTTRASAGVLKKLRAWQQALNESKDRRHRRRVLLEDLSWERRLHFKHLHA